jgi:hypothetical protein
MTRHRILHAAALAAAVLACGAGPRYGEGNAAVVQDPVVKAPAPATVEPSRLLLAVVRRDGVMLPFAEYERGNWSTPWPGNFRNVDLPANLEGIPERWWGGAPLADWRLWRPGEEEPVPVKLHAPIMIAVGWERRLGIRTDYLSPSQPPFAGELPYPKDGLAIAGGGRLLPIASVSRLVPRFREFGTSLKAEIDAAEEKSVSRIRNASKWAHPVSRESRAAHPIELEAWYRTNLSQPGWAVSYIEAVKRYPPGPDDEGCGLETFVSGWVHHNERSPKPKTELTAAITYCDRAGASYLLPLGVLRLRNRTHWVVQLGGREQEWYSVVEATPDRVRFVAEYFGGGRPG